MTGEDSYSFLPIFRNYQLPRTPCGEAPPRIETSRLGLFHLLLLSLSPIIIPARGRLASSYDISKPYACIYDIWAFMTRREMLQPC